jgi:hypothetical protein
MKRLLSTACGVAALAIASACVSAKRPVAATEPPPPGVSLWRAPSQLESQDLFNGPWGASRAPNPDWTFTLVKYKRSGVNPGLTVRDPRGRQWSVKQPYPGNLDSEPQVEVALSRLLSALGYHQPPVYYLPEFTLEDDWGTHREAGGRFRLEVEELEEGAAWRWEENPFVGTRPYQGLLTLMMMFNNTDIKNANNSIYEYRDGGRTEQRYVVRDLGASLGDTGKLAPRKNHPEAFAREPFILGVEGGHVVFAYKSWYRNYVRDRITPGDVAWIADLLAKLSDRQWQDAFRAAGYEPAVANAFIETLKRKVAQGQALRRARP